MRLRRRLLLLRAEAVQRVLNHLRARTAGLRGRRRGSRGQRGAGLRLTIVGEISAGGATGGAGHPDLKPPAVCSAPAHVWGSRVCRPICERPSTHLRGQAARAAVGQRGSVGTVAQRQPGLSEPVPSLCLLLWALLS